MMVLERLERTIRNLNHPNTEHENVWYSNGLGIRMFGIRAPTVTIQFVFILFLQDLYKPFCYFRGPEAMALQYLLQGQRA